MLSVDLTGAVDADGAQRARLEPVLATADVRWFVVGGTNRDNSTIVLTSRVLFCTSYYVVCAAVGCVAS